VAKAKEKVGAEEADGVPRLGNFRLAHIESSFVCCKHISLLKLVANYRGPCMWYSIPPALDKKFTQSMSKGAIL